MSNVGRCNVYLCSTCERATVTVDVDEGVTPFIIKCRATGREGDCNGRAFSQFYTKEPPSEPQWQWYKPKPEERPCFTTGEWDHVSCGGLLLRRVGSDRRMSEVTTPASREGAVHVARELREAMRIPPGFRVVVVTTDESGAFVGVSSNTHPKDVEAILNAALCGAERVNHG